MGVLCLTSAQPLLPPDEVLEEPTSDDSYDGPVLLNSPILPYHEAVRIPTLPACRVLRIQPTNDLEYKGGTYVWQFRLPLYEAFQWVVHCPSLTSFTTAEVIWMETPWIKHVEALLVDIPSKLHSLTIEGGFEGYLGYEVRNFFCRSVRHGSPTSPLFAAVTHIGYFEMT